MTVAPRAVVIVNPRSQNGALGRQWPDVAQVVASELGRFEGIATQSQGEATRLANEAARSGVELVVAVGGDGTIHEVVNGLFDANDQPVNPNTKLGVIPFGTGGDFRRTLGLTKDLRDAVRVLAAGHTRPMDVGSLRYATERGGKPTQRAMFANIASFGLSGLVDRIANGSSKALGGKISFFLATTRAVAQYKNQPVRIVLDGQEHDAIEANVTTCAVANGKYFGGGMKVAPWAELDDGKLDVVVIRDLTRMDFLLNGSRIYKGTHIDRPRVQFRRAVTVEAKPVDANAEVLLDVDGEQPGMLPAVFRLHPKAISVVCPG